MAGTTAPIENENGRALYHQARFDGLKPDTRYVYRVRAADGWSEWLPFRTAKVEFAPFRFIYLGDTQNDILEIGSRVIRSAFKEAGPAALVVHAGDLVAQREVKVHDDEWGEWTEAGGRAFAMTPQLPASGNHEYVDHILPNGEESRLLGPHWPLQFALPDNGADGAKATSYYVDYQGVRFIVLDGTAAIDLGAGESQTRWLDRVLAKSPARWNVALFHQPIYTCARPEDTEELKAAWKPIFDARNIDLVLQGHDHCYGRVSNPAGAEASRADSAAGRPQGPVYVVSVTGSKMYGLNDRADTQPVRAAENTELYQLIDVEADRLSFRAFTATGGLYDAFTLER
ncbi:MAG: hydrolase, partial [Brevundimonas sp. 67-6]